MNELWGIGKPLVHRLSDKFIRDQFTMYYLQSLVDREFAKDGLPADIDNLNFELEMLVHYGKEIQRRAALN